MRPLFISVALLVCATVNGAAASEQATNGMVQGGKYYLFNPSPANGGLPATPWPTTVYDAATHQRVTYKLDRGGSGYVRGEDMLTRKQWHADISPGGGIKGRDLDGADWVYRPNTRTYINLTAGRTCVQTSLLHVCPI